MYYGQVVSRLLVKCSISTSSEGSCGDMMSPDGLAGVDDGRGTSSTHVFFPATSDGVCITDSTHKGAGASKDMSPADMMVNSLVRRSIMAVCERTFDKAQESCLILLAKVEDVGIVRRVLGVLTEVSKR